MGKIVKLFNEKYGEYLNEISENLTLLEDQVEEYAVNLAAAGKWQEWNNLQIEGTIINFGEAIYYSGDFRVDVLLDLKEKITLTIKKIKNHDRDQY